MSGKLEAGRDAWIWADATLSVTVTAGRDVGLWSSDKVTSIISADRDVMAETGHSTVLSRRVAM